MSSDDFIQQLRTSARKEMNHLLESLSGEPIEVDSLIVEGIPWEEILERTQDFDLVVMNRPHPRSRWNWFSKKIRERVMHQARCRIWVVQE